MIINGDSLDVLKTLEENSVDSIVTDPPYGLVSIVKRFGKESSAPAKFGTDGAFQRASKGFMGKEWDGSGIEYNVELWEQCLRVLKPGGHLLAFGGSRTYHRLASAVEDAGFEIRDQIMYVYGSGFPKSHNIYKTLQKSCTCGNMVEYDNERTKQNTECEVRPVRDNDVQETINNQTEQRKVLQSELSQQGIPISGNTSCNAREGQPSLERGSNTQEGKGELQRSDLPEVSEGVSGNGEERRLHNATQDSNGSTPEQASDENGSSTSQRPQSEQQPDRKPCTLCDKWGTQKIRRTAEEIYGFGSALKPSHEPIVVARKPLSESTIAENVLRWGTGGINIDGSRVGTEENLGRDNKARTEGTSYVVQKEDLYIDNSKGLGRFPANFIHDGSDEVVGLFPETKSSPRTATKGGTGGVGINTPFSRGNETSNHSDSGSASRFFYCAKAPKSERWVYLTCNCQTVKLASWPKQDQNLNEQTGGTSPEADTYDEQSEVDLFSNTFISGKKKMAKSLSDTHSITSTTAKQTTDSAISSSSMPLNTSDSTEDVNLEMENGGSPAQSVKNSSKLQPTTGISPQKDGHCTGVVVPATSAGWYRKSVCVDCGSEVRHNGHPTQKPTSLMQYLVRLVTPAGGTVLDPFMGSGSTGKACVLEGFGFIGIELDAEYCKIAEARIKVV